MKISLIYPETGVHTGGKNWMYYLGKSLEEKCEVEHNRCSHPDVILGMTIAEIGKIRQAVSRAPYILYNWDMHPKLQPLIGKWDEIGWDKLMENALEVWTQTYYHAQMAEEMSGVRHYVMPMGALDFETENLKPENGGYAMMASRRVDYKRFDLFEEACEEIGMPYVSRHPHIGDREEYLEDLRKCKVMVVASEEEANTPMSGYEAAFLGKPLILSDIPPHREEWEECATYFTDKEDLKKKLMRPSMGKKAREKAHRYKLEAFRDRIWERLQELLS